jgi:hemin uptake protein HemP
MKNGKKWGLAGLTVIASTALLVSFTNSPSDEKKKKYQVIHHENQETVTYDTIISMDSKYTVEQFLADKGIESKNVEIIHVPNMISELGERMHGEEVNIICEMDENGNKVTKKFVNGKEVELSPEELKKIESHKATGGENRVIIKRDGSHGSDHGGEFRVLDEHNVEIRVEVDDNGNTTITKIENGEEVEMTEEELNNFHAAEGHEGHEMRIFIEDGKTLDQEGMTEEMEIKIEKMMEGIDTGDGQREIIIKIDSDSENFEGIDMEFFEDGENTFEWISDNQDHQIKLMTSDGDEEFTLVLVTENFDESVKMEHKMRIDTSKESFELFPNPTDGTFTVRFTQDKKAKTDLRITDVNGKVVFEDKLGKFSGTYEKEINLKKFGAGTYLLSIEKDGKVETKKIIVK